MTLDLPTSDIVPPPMDALCYFGLVEINDVPLLVDYAGHIRGWSQESLVPIPLIFFIFSAQ